MHRLTAGWLIAAALSACSVSNNSTTSSTSQGSTSVPFPVSQASGASAGSGGTSNNGTGVGTIVRNPSGTGTTTKPGGGSPAVAANPKAPTTGALPSTKPSPSTNPGPSNPGTPNTGSSGGGTSRFAVSMEDMQAIGPFASWANAKTQYGAKGDGSTDDTDALQTALNDLGQTGKAFVLYLPSGTYRITRTLHLTGTGYYQGVQLIGQEPTTTKILWDGTPGGAMLLNNGGVGTRFSRLTWDGNKIAGFGVQHWWNKSTNPKYYGGSVEHSDEVFEDMGVGIMAGRLGASYGNLDSEGQIRRVTFLRNWEAGLDTGSWNALDWWVWDSRFTDCARGVTNLFSVTDSGATGGAGGFHVYRSLFERSTVADFNIQNTQWFGLHNNVSVGSRRFIQAEQMGSNSARLIVENNRVLDTTESVSIYVANLGPLILLDNYIRSTINAKAPVVRMDDNAAGRDALSIGNRFTVDNPIAGRDTSDRLVSIGDLTVARSQISSNVPAPSPTPAWSTQQVFEVKIDSTTSDIQTVIDQAAASGASNPIVHFQSGLYRLTATLTIPAKTRVQLAGDGWGASFEWHGGVSGGPMFKLLGPSYATLRDLQFVSPLAQAIALSQADQVGGRILVVGSTFGPVSASALKNTSLEFQASPAISSLTLDHVESATAIGNGGIGPVQVSASNILISDTWYEGRDAGLYRIASGNFTYLGGLMAPNDLVHSAVRSINQPAVLLDGLSGNVTFAGVTMNLSGVPSGVGVQIGSETSATHAFFMGTSNSANVFLRNGSQGAVGLYMSKEHLASAGAVSIPNQGSSDNSFVLNSFNQARSLAWDFVPYSAPAGATDVRIYRVRANQVAQGLRISGY